MTNWMSETDVILRDLESEPLLNILRWASGSLTFDAIAGIEAAAVAEYLRQHRIVGLGLRAIEHAPNGYDASRLKSILREEFEAIQIQVRSRNELLAELSNVASQGFIVLKGNTVSRLSGDKYLERFSWDVDLIADVPGSLGAELIRFGSEETYLPATHEEINIRFREQDIDIHRHFPIFRAEHPGRFSSGSREDAWSEIGEQALPYQLLASETVSWKPSVSTSTLQLTATYAAFITLQHIFIDYIRLYPPILRFRPRVRAFELIELEKLFSLPSFDRRQFQKLLTRFDCLDYYTRIVNLHRSTFADAARTNTFLLTEKDPILEEAGEWSEDFFVALGLRRRLTVATADIVTRPFSLVEAVDRSGLSIISLNIPQVLALGPDSERSFKTSWKGEKFPVRMSSFAHADNLKITLHFAKKHIAQPDVWVNLDKNYFRSYIDPRHTTSRNRNDSYDLSGSIQITDVAGRWQVDLDIRYPEQSEYSHLITVLIRDAAGGANGVYAEVVGTFKN